MLYNLVTGGHKIAVVLFDLFITSKMSDLSYTHYKYPPNP